MTAAKAPSPRSPLSSPRPHLPRPPWAAVQKANGGGSPVVAQAPNRTGLPDPLKSGIEELSGLAMDDVRVHLNSSEPAKLGALAYAKGSDIHLGPGQEPHLPHEAWHVVQQKQGRVRPTLQRKGLWISLDPALESEADKMSFAARQTAPDRRTGPDAAVSRGLRPPALKSPVSHALPGTIQCVLRVSKPEENNGDYSSPEIRAHFQGLVIEPSLKAAVSRKVETYLNDDIDDDSRKYLSLADLTAQLVHLEAPVVATQYVIDQGIVHGNVAQGVKGSQGASAQSVYVMREFPDDGGRLVHPFKEKVIDPFLDKYKGTAAHEVLARHATAMASVILKAGNCDEFSAIIQMKLMEMLKGYWVGAASIGSVAHRFMVLSRKKLSEGKLDASFSNEIVVDAWADYTIQTVSQFVATINSEAGRKYQARNILIEDPHECTGNDVITVEMKVELMDLIEKFKPSIPTHYSQEDVENIVNDANYSIQEKEDYGGLVHMPTTRTVKDLRYQQK